MTKTIGKLIAIIAVISLVIGLLPLPAPANAQADPLQLVAALTGRNASDLTLLDATSATLLNGRQVLRVKALDRSTGETVGGDFEDGLAVDYLALQAEAGKQWRAAYGALTKAAVERLAGMGPDERVNVSVWLAGEIDSLPRPELQVTRDESQGTASGAGVPAEEAAAPGLAQIDGKALDQPLRADEIPAYVTAAQPIPGSLVEAPEKSAEEIAQGEKALFDSIPPADADGQHAAWQLANQDFLRSQVLPLQEKFLQHASAAGFSVSSYSDFIPSATLNSLTRQQIEELAAWPEIDAIYIVPENAGPALNDANPAQNANLVNSVGYDGSGVTVAVTEGERVFFANPYLVMRNCYNCGAGYANHPTAVAGFIKSTYSGYKGLANDATVDSANGSYSDWPTMTGAIDWASTNNQILNNSWYWDSPNTATFWEADRRLDYIVRSHGDFVAVAAGNFGNGCGGGFSTFVTSPAKGYNVMSVGNYEDSNNINWTDDAMDTCSSFGDPANDASGSTHEKPEVAAIGATLDSTLTNTGDPYVGPVGSGTSYASPMVAALAADLIEAQPTLASYPEAIKALIMATALHNIEGSSEVSEVDGVGGVDFTAALASAERGNFDARYVTSADTYPIIFTQYAYAGELVRFVITWDSNPAGDYTTDVLPADLDLYAYRADGTTQVDYSTTASNNFEIVQFVAPASETYQFKVEKWSYSGGATYLGSAWWRGEYRIGEEIGYTDLMASPLGTHLAIYPADWSPTVYWRAVGIRSNDSDHDLTLYDASYFDNPAARIYRASSSYAGPIDFVVVDGNHRSSSISEHYRVSKFSGTGGYNVVFSNPGHALSQGTYGPYTLSPSQVLRVFDVYMYQNTPYRISVVPHADNASDLGVKLYRSVSGDASTYTKGQSSWTRWSDASTAFNAVESVQHVSSVYDWLGLVVYSKTHAQAKFYIKLEKMMALPALLK